MATNSSHVLTLRPAPFETAVESLSADGNSSKLRVLETYMASGQGEGIWTGMPSAFVRLAGCTVGCNYCDTKYSWRASQGEDLTVPQLLERVHKIVRPWSDVVLTGGEPMEHPLALVHQLVHELTRRYQVTIETSGTVMPEAHVPWVNTSSLTRMPLLWSVAPKLEHAGSRFRVTATTVAEWINYINTMPRTALQFKWVCRSAEDVDEVYELVKDAPTLLRHDVSNFIQPVTLTAWPTTEQLVEDLLTRTRVLQDYVMRHTGLGDMAIRGVRTMVRPQLHALVWGNKRLV
jgi:7-carboxy-7-deazaguanine synthase